MGQAHGADLLRVGGVGVGRRARLGQAVALEDGDAAAAEEVPEPRAERGSRAPGVPDVTAECRPHLAVDEPVEQGVPEAEHGARAAGIQRPAVGEGGGLRLGEDLGVPLGAGLAPGAVVRVLPQPRHRQHARRPVGGQFGGGGGHVGQAQDRARVDGAVLDDLGVAVRERQEQKRGVAGVEDPREAIILHAVADVGHDVAVAQHAALRAAGRAGGIDDLGEVTSAPGVTPLLDLLRCHRRAERPDAAEAAGPAGVDPPHVAERGQAGPGRGDLRGVVAGLDHHDNRSRVTEDPLDLLERGGRVDGNGDTAGRQDRIIEQRPLEPRP